MSSIQTGSLLLLLVLLACQATASAQSGSDADRDWQRLDGNARDIGVGSSGIVHIVDNLNRVWRWQQETRRWKKLPGNFSRIDTDASGIPWAVTTRGELRRYTGSYWQPVTSGVKDVGIGAYHVIITYQDGRLARWSAEQNQFVPVTGEGRYIDVDHAGNPWVIRGNNEVWFLKENTWHKTDYRANDITLGKDSLFISEQGFEQDPDGTRSIALGPEDVPWLVTNSGEIFIKGLFESPVETQPIVDEPESSIRNFISWKKVPGKAAQLAIGNNGTVVAINTNQVPWRWDPESKAHNKWSRLPGKFKRLAVARDGKVWGIDLNNKIRLFKDNYWLPGKVSASDIAINDARAFAILLDDGTPAIRSGNNFLRLPGIHAISIDLDSTNQLHALDESGMLHRYHDNQWQTINAPLARDFSIGPKDSLMIVDRSGQLHRKRADSDAWKKLNGSFLYIEQGPGDRPWGITDKNNILASTFFVPPDQPGDSVEMIDPKSDKGSSEPLPTTRDKLVFQKVRGNARDVSIGMDGSVFALDPEGQLIRYSNDKQRFLVFPGNFSEIAVAPDGTPWGINASGQVYMHDEKLWKQIKNISAVDIAISQNNTVIVSDATERLHRYDGQRFNRLRGTEGKADPRGSMIALDANDNPWTIRKSGQVYRCDRSPCERIEGIRARAIAAGPDGSVFIIDHRDSIRIFNTATNQFDRLSNKALTISVGPQGKPWITTEDNEVFASAFFSRDETDDLQLALATSPTTSTGSTGSTGTSTFTFTKNLSMQEIPVSVSGLNNIDDFAISPTGRVLAIDLDGTIIEYSDSAKAFTTLLYSKTVVRRIQMAADETIWGIDGSDKFYRMVNGTFVEVSGLNASTTTIAPYLAVGADGSVFASDQDGNLYKYSESKNKFVLFDTQPNGVARVHGVEPDGDPWVIDENTSKLYAFENNAYTYKRDKTDFFNIGAGGAVYIIDQDNKVHKYNSTNDSFDQTNQEANGIQIAPDGRLWTATHGVSGLTIYRAR